MLAAMTALILAAESAGTYVGDDWAIVAYVAAGIAMLVAAITTAIVTPRAEHHDH